MQPNLPLNHFLLFCEILSLESILCSFSPALRTPAGGLELPHCGLKLQVAMYFGLGFFPHLFVLEQCSVSPGVKNKEVDHLPLKYDLMPKFPGQLPETKLIEKLGTFTACTLKWRDEGLYRGRRFPPCLLNSFHTPLLRGGVFPEGENVTFAHKLRD